MLGTRCLTTCLTHQPLLPFDLRSLINNVLKLTLACAVLLLVTDVLLTLGFYLRATARSIAQRSSHFPAQVVVAQLNAYLPSLITSDADRIFLRRTSNASLVVSGSFLDSVPIQSIMATYSPPSI
ncbi:hypothetical protein C4J97_1211 [Pseudomonas orientalis]|nr:hypothetical protein C4J97_1211 [Pseudomonas orientalis]